MTDAFYIPSGEDNYISTDHTRGPWTAESQHAGPPAALLGRAIESLEGADGLQVSRITFEILKAVPVSTLTVKARIVRPGRKIQLSEATLAEGDDVLMHARAWSIRSQEIGLPAAGEVEPPPGPETGREAERFPAPYEGYLDAMEGSFVKGSFIEPGPATAWMKPRYPLLEGEPISSLGRVLIAADSASGVSSELDWRKWLFVNPDLTVYLHRYPRGQWVCIEGRTTLQPHGIGHARSTLYDEEGAIGSTGQSLFLAPRP